MLNASLANGIPGGGPLELGTIAGKELVGVAEVGLGEPCPRPTEQDGVPPRVSVVVVKCTSGTVAVVTSVVVKLLPGMVRPDETPVV